MRNEGNLKFLCLQLPKSNTMPISNISQTGEHSPFAAYQNASRPLSTKQVNLARCTFACRYIIWGEKSRCLLNKLHPSRRAPGHVCALMWNHVQCTPFIHVKTNTLSTLLVDKHSICTLSERTCCWRQKRQLYYHFWIWSWIKLVDVVLTPNHEYS